LQFIWTGQDSIVRAKPKKSKFRLIEKIDSTCDCDLYKINPIIHKSEDFKVKTKKVFIDIPKGLSFKCLYGQTYTDYFIFNDSSTVIIIKNQLNSDTVDSDLRDIQQKLTIKGF
jgi:hypothetical protein